MNILLINWFSCILEFLIFTSLGTGIFKESNILLVKKNICYIIPFSAIATYLEYYLLNNVDSLFFNLVIIYIFFLLIFNQSSTNTFFALVLSFAYAMLVELSLVVIFSLLPTPQLIPIEILGNIFTLLISIIIATTRFPSKIYKIVIAKKLPIFITITNLFIFVFVLNILNKLSSDDFVDLLISLLIPFITIVYMNIIFFKEHIKQSQEEKKYTIYQSYIPIIEEMMDQIRMRQHRYDNDIQTIKGLANTSTDYISLKTAINQYSGYITDENIDITLLKLNLHFLAALLYQKTKQAKSSDVIMTLDIPSPMLYTNTPEYEIIEISGILIDNMLEATPAKSQCKISIKTCNHKLIITTTNPSAPTNMQTISLMFTKGYTTKKDGQNRHGYGLYNLSELVKKNNGKIFVENIIVDNSTQLLISVEI